MVTQNHDLMFLTHTFIYNTRKWEREAFSCFNHNIPILRNIAAWWWVALVYCQVCTLYATMILKKRIHLWAGHFSRNNRNLIIYQKRKNEMQTILIHKIKWFHIFKCIENYLNCAKIHPVKTLYWNMFII